MGRDLIQKAQRFALRAARTRRREYVAGRFEACGFLEPLGVELAQVADGVRLERDERILDHDPCPVQRVVGSRVHRGHGDKDDEARGRERAGEAGDREARAAARRALDPAQLEAPADVVGRDIIHARPFEAAKGAGERVLHHSAASAPGAADPGRVAERRSNSES